MVYPVVVYCIPAWSITVTLYKTFPENVFLRRPIVLPGICFWFIDQ